MENTVDKQKMDSLKALADTNLKVSEARGLLIKLEETETEYLIGREQKAMARIQKVHDDSADILKDTQTNYETVHELLTSVSEFAGFLEGAYATFKGLLADFDDRNTLWEANCKKWEDEAAETRRLIKIDQVKIENGKKSHEDMAASLERDRIKLVSDRGTVERAINRLKENRV